MLLEALDDDDEEDDSGQNTEGKNSLATNIKVNKLGEYSVKLVYPGIFHHLLRSQFIVGFSRLHKRLANEVTPGMRFFLFVTKIKRVVGLVEVIDKAVYNEQSDWPYEIPVKMIIGPKKQGVKLEDIDITIRRMPGHTTYSLSTKDAELLTSKLEKLPDLASDEIEALKKSFVDNHINRTWSDLF
jgi:hypothetical protein